MKNSGRRRFATAAGAVGLLLVGCGDGGDAAPGAAAEGAAAETAVVATTAEATAGQALSGISFEVHKDPG